MQLRMCILSHGQHAHIKLNNRDEILKRSLAVSTDREIVPSFQLFQKFFAKSQMNYADSLIMDVFEAPPGIFMVIFTKDVCIDTWL